MNIGLIDTIASASSFAAMAVPHALIPETPDNAGGSILVNGKVPLKGALTMIQAGPNGGYWAEIALDSPDATEHLAYARDCGAIIAVPASSRVLDSLAKLHFPQETGEAGLTSSGVTMKARNQQARLRQSILPLGSLIGVFMADMAA